MAVSLTGLAVLVPMAGSAGPTAASVVKPTDFNTWTPFRTKVPKNSKVVWKNTSFEVHNVKSYKGTWLPKKMLNPGVKAAKVFRKRGLFFYRCTIHSTIVDGDCGGMCGEVKVTRPVS